MRETSIDVQAQLKALRLNGMATAWADLTEQGGDTTLAASRWLVEHLLQAEDADRAMRSIAHQMKAARFPMHRDLAGFDFTVAPVDRALIQKLADLSFTQDAQNVVLVGGPGTGKTHLATALGIAGLTRHAKRVPVFVKIAPDLDEAQVAVIAATLQRHGMDGVIATNTTISRAAVQGMRHSEETGGLSGAPVLEASNQVIRQLRAALGSRFPIIGVGGIMSAEDAVSKVRAGADVVQIYTGLIYEGPALVVKAAKAIKAMG